MRLRVEVSCIQQGARKGKALGEPVNQSAFDHTGWRLRPYPQLQQEAAKYAGQPEASVHMRTETQNTLILG